MAKTKAETHKRRKAHIRKKVNGTAERPRLSIFRSARHMYAQIVDDSANKTLAHVSTLDEKIAAELKGLKKTERAKKIGATIASLCKSKGIEKVVFDRNGFIYHGRVLALADAAREAGLKF